MRKKEWKLKWGVWVASEVLRTVSCLDQVTGENWPVHSFNTKKVPRLLYPGQLCMFVYAPMHAEEGVRSPKPGVTDDCEPPWGCWGENPVFWKNSQCFNYWVISIAPSFLFTSVYSVHIGSLSGKCVYPSFFIKANFCVFWFSVSLTNLGNSQTCHCFALGFIIYCQYFFCCSFCFEKLFFLQRLEKQTGSQLHTFKTTFFMNRLDPG